ncbi:hypothetical protein LNTAR_16483 [Lentisphaera araneosa HTCC2155]|uniref:Heparinase II/III-like C-terminal domain-containing protein n=1 Tax=Lentisphaera araneosa HTCC2155 TaxID=313628 RepID=A6DQB1_9BACT|nr:heparinase II/III family protein [Lentisphaera araneosa]EDM26162.1 hypothetical protein LNTAR_16483 [Lentisphaera araneosa HTCC2155]
MKKLFITVMLSGMSIIASPIEKELPSLENPFTVEYVQQNLSKDHPRLVFTPQIVADLKKKIKIDPVCKNIYAAIRHNANDILKEPILAYEMVGRRLKTSGRMSRRMDILGVVYLIEKDPVILKRIEQELIAVCSIPDWNPSHFLDVAGMSLGVAIALDWTAGDLPESTFEFTQNALINKGLKADGRAKSRIVRTTNNWNQVCNGAMIAAAIAVAEQEPELSASTIQRALEALPRALVHYGPDGVYPEGSSYWGYATSRSVITIAMLESAFGRDFGHYDFPGFKESAYYQLYSTAPSGGLFNYSDCRDIRKSNGDSILAWFASKTGNSVFFEKDRFLKPVDQLSKLGTIDSMALAWISQYQEKITEELPTIWSGQGANPIAVFTSDKNDGHGFYVGCKGGKAKISHGNMDAGSFVFELNGVRWGIDMGLQEYHDLEKVGFNLWAMDQNAQRWSLLSKNNFGHSVLSVNNELFDVNGFASLVKVDNGEQPEVLFNTTEVYGGGVKRATRRFVKEGASSLIIEDEVETSDVTQKLTWQFMTTSDVDIVKGGAILRQDNEVLYLKDLSDRDTKIKVVSLDPPPLQLDEQITGLKRIEITTTVEPRAGQQINLRIELSDKRNDLGGGLPRV